MHNKGQKWYGPTEAEDIKKRGQEYTEVVYKKDLHDPDNHDGPCLLIFHMGYLALGGTKGFVFGISSPHGV